MLAGRSLLRTTRWFARKHILTSSSAAVGSVIESRRFKHVTSGVQGIRNSKQKANVKKIIEDDEEENEENQSNDQLDLENDT